MINYLYEVVKAGKGDIVFLNFTMKREDTGSDDICIGIQQSLPTSEFSMVNIYAEDWNCDYSPWKFVDEAAHKDFAGGGEKLLNWVKDILVDELKRGLCKPQAKFFIGGYSLAGLFCLWAACESDIFEGCVIGSASLWYPGMLEYIASVNLSKKIYVYMSLGTKEEKARDRYMSQVGDNTRLIYECLKGAPWVKEVVLEWNPGNHFTEVSGRMVKGYVHMLNTIGIACNHIL